jgi:hypothetical protein
MKCFIINFNRLTLTKNMCQWLAMQGHSPIIIDNLSTYPPLIEWYMGECPYMVYMLKENLGHLALWKSGILDNFSDEFYVVSDPDLSLDGIPLDWEEVLRRALDNNPQVTKAGFSLRIDDLPKNEYTKEVIKWESRFWQTKQDSLGNYRSDLDTTFSLYERSRDFGALPPEGNKFHWAVRTPHPYTARHLPFYNTKESILADPEELYYHNSVTTYWSGILKQKLWK